MIVRNWLAGLALGAVMGAGDGAPRVEELVSRYADGALREVRSYRAGREVGVHRGYWPSGAPRFEYEYRDGLMHGRAREWHEGGGQYREARYVRGHEEGAQRMWSADGSLRASYVVRDGRRFGFIGAVGCTGAVAADPGDAR